MHRLLLAALVVSVAGCGTPGDPELTCDPGAPAVTLAGALQDQVIEPRCATCHEAGYTYGDYSSAAATGGAVRGIASRYAGMPGQLKIVDPANLANSSLWLKVLGGASKGRAGPRGENVLGKMPSDGSSLTAEQQKLIKDWICSGAN